jgi:hypothetical protein
MIACNFHFNFIPEELVYMKNSSTKYELKCSAAVCVPGTDLGDTEGLNLIGSSVLWCIVVVGPNYFANSTEDS